MVLQQTQTVLETDVFGKREDWGEGYYNQRLMKMAAKWEQEDHKGSEGLMKDIRAWSRRQNTPYDKPHPMKQRPRPVT